MAEQGTAVGKITAFVAAPLSDNIMDVPGIGERAAANFARQGIITPKQLIGMFLMLRGPDMDDAAASSAFYDWIRDTVGVIHFRHLITYSIAAKINTMIPGYFVLEVSASDE